MDKLFEDPKSKSIADTRRSIEEAMGLEAGALLTWPFFDPIRDSEDEAAGDEDGGPITITEGHSSIDTLRGTQSGSVGERESGPEALSDDAVTAAVTECPEQGIVIELLGCLAVHTRLRVDILATAVGESPRKVKRVLANFDEWLEYHRHGESVSIEGDRAQAVLRWTLVDASRRDALVDTIAATDQLREEGLHLAVENLVEAYSIGHEYGDSEYCTAIIEFANRTLDRVLEVSLGLTGWFTVAESIDILARHGLPIEPTLLTDKIGNLIDGYQVLAEEYPELTEGASSSFGDSKRIAGNNLGQLIAAVCGNSHVEYGCGNPVSLMNDIALAGDYCRQDPSVVEFRMSIFGEAVKALTTPYPERCTDEAVRDIEETVVDGLVESSTNLEAVTLTSDRVSTRSPAGRRAELRTRLWTAAASKIVYAHMNEPETQAHWTRFAFGRAVAGVISHAGSDGNSDNVRLDSLLQTLYVETARELPAQFRSVADWKRGIEALDTALYGTVDQHCPAIDAEEVRARALDEVAAESTQCRHAFKQMIREGLVD